MCQNIHDRYFVAYFDFLGFREYVKENPLSFTVSDYKEVLKSIKEKEGIYFDVDKIICSWFSDTFLFCAKADTDEFERAFGNIQLLSSSFFKEMIFKQIPLRGALTVGEFYPEPKRNIFLGKALIKAYDYAENQNWLGFVLTTEIITLLKKYECNEEIGLCERTYKEYKVPYKESKTRRLLAYRLDKFNRNGSNMDARDYWLWDALVQMEHTAPKKAKVKYQKTKEFMLESCPRLKTLVDEEDK